MVSNLRQSLSTATRRETLWLNTSINVIPSLEEKLTECIKERQTQFHVGPLS